MQRLESLQEKEAHKILWNFSIETPITESGLEHQS